MMRGGGTPIKSRWRDENVKEALDLCLSCKGCKGDCPVNVDIATYKSEFLSHYYSGRLRPRHAYAFGWIDRFARLASRAPGIVNWATQTPGLSRLAKLAAGMTPERTIPTFAPETFRSWFLRRMPQTEARSKVLLWPDTFNNYFYPDTARAATEVLEHLGFEVVIPDRILCCGRPLYDYGMLDRAEAYLEDILRVMRPHIEAGTPMVVLEPSCCSVFRDEMPSLMPNRVEAKNLQELTFLLSEFLVDHAKGRLPSLRRHAVVQGHCHHKSVMRFGDEKAVFEAIGLDAQVLESGCCGLAGSFGFEQGKYEISQACGERVLFPKVREQTADTLILADGFSCRTQIEQGTGRSALHLAEVLKMAFDDGPEGPAGDERPEAAIVAKRRSAIRRSMRRTGVVMTLGIGLAAAIGAGFYWRARRNK
jgi:Fe-S oxidoreductase